MAAEHAAVAVDLVDDDGFEPLEEPVPQPVGVGEDAVVEHVRRGQQHGGLALPDGLLLRLRLPAGVLGDGDPGGEAQPCASSDSVSVWSLMSATCGATYSVVARRSSARSKAGTV